MATVSYSYLMGYYRLNSKDFCNHGCCEPNAKLLKHDCHWVGHALGLTIGTTCADIMGTRSKGTGCSVSPSALLKSTSFIPLPLEEGCLVFLLNKGVDAKRVKNKLLMDEEIERVGIYTEKNLFLYSITKTAGPEGKFVNCNLASTYLPAWTSSGYPYCFCDLPPGVVLDKDVW